VIVKNKVWYVGVVMNTVLLSSDSRYRVGNMAYEMWFVTERDRERLKNQ
jgi:hypothetical protein